MRRLSESQFREQFPLREPNDEMPGVARGEYNVSRDTRVSGIVEGDVFLPRGVHAVIEGIVEGSVHIEPEAVAYIHGTVEGDLVVNGAAYVDGEIAGSVSGDRDAFIYAAREGLVRA